MGNSKYTMYAVGGFVGKGVMQSRYVGIAAVAKPGGPASPRAVSNELLCNGLARAICLPVSPGVVVEHLAVNYYVSLDFTTGGVQLPPADPRALVAHDATLACGVVLFDIWIVNPDRHPGNLAFDQTKGRVHVFDHSHAFMPAAGRAYLDTQRDALGIPNHCLAPILPALKGMESWFARINEVPEYLIADAVDTAVGYGIDDADRDFVLAFLLDRRVKLKDLVLKHPSAFPAASVNSWG